MCDVSCVEDDWCEMRCDEECHIVFEKWVKHYRVSLEYPGPSPSLKGAGDNDLPP